MQFRYRVLLSISLFVIYLFLVSCSGPQRVEHEVRHPTGEPFPDPIFMLQTIGQEKPIRITFFYSATSYTEDLDGVLVGQKSFLDPRRDQYMDVDQDVKLVLRVLNPTNRHYKISVKQNIDFEDGGNMQSLHDVAESDMKYREFFHRLPTWKGVEKVAYLVMVTNEDGEPLISTRGIKYFIRKGGGKAS